MDYSSKEVPGYIVILLLLLNTCRSPQPLVYHCNTGTRNPTTWIDLCEAVSFINNYLICL